MPSGQSALLYMPYLCLHASAFHINTIECRESFDATGNIQFCTEFSGKENFNITLLMRLRDTAYTLAANNNAMSIPNAIARIECFCLTVKYLPSYMPCTYNDDGTYYWAFKNTRWNYIIVAWDYHLRYADAWLATVRCINFHERKIKLASVPTSTPHFTILNGYDKVIISMHNKRREHILRGFEARIYLLHMTFILLFEREFYSRLPQRKQLP